MTMEGAAEPERLPYDPNQLVDRVAPDVPESFREETAQACAMAAALDRDPVAALADPATRRFVARMAEVGFVRDYQRGATQQLPMVNAAACRASLPAWLQPEFLQEQDIRPRPGQQPPVDPIATERAYERFIAEQGLELATVNYDGAYYKPSDVKHPSASPEWCKIYVEGATLQAALEGGAMARAYAALAEAGIQPYEMKVSDSDRMVLYFGQGTDMGQVGDILRAAAVDSRGPAQDIWQIVDNGRGTPELQNVESNDNALRDQVIGWNRHNPHPYTPETFMEQYVRQCAKWGKSPLDPYQVSFVVARFGADDPRLQDAAFLEQLGQLGAPYPVVIRPYPRNPLPLSRLPMPVST